MSKSSKIVMLVEAKGAAKAAADIDDVNEKVTGLDKKSKTTEKSSSRVAAGWRRLGFAGKAAAGGAALLAMKLGKDALAEYREAYKVGRQTNAVITATGGVANVSADHVGDLAESISGKVGIDDEAIQTGSNLLLTFKAVRNEAGKGSAIFDRATQAAVDLSAAGFGSIDGASKMLGKALNDPTRGITALSRAGVTFTDQQKKQIETMQESGNILGAQKIIMQEVESQVKGSAEAQADPIDRLKTSWANLLETVGTKGAPIFNKLVTFAVDSLIPALIKIGGFVDRNKNLIGPLVGVVVSMIAAWKVATAVMAVFNAVAMANPFVLIVVGIVAAVALIVIFRKKIMSVITSVIGFVRKHWKTMLAILTGPIGIAVLLISRNFRKIVALARSLPGRVGRALSGLWDGIKNTFRSALNWVIKKWNSFHLSIGPIRIPAAPDIPKISINTPNIPMFAQGGEQHGVGSRWISGESGAELGEVTSSGVKITPLGGDAAGGGEVVLHLNVNLDGRKVGEGVRRVALRDMLASSAA